MDVALCHSARKCILWSCCSQGKSKIDALPASLSLWILFHAFRKVIKDSAKEGTNLRLASNTRSHIGESFHLAIQVLSRVLVPVLAGSTRRNLLLYMSRTNDGGARVNFASGSTHLNAINDRLWKSHSV